MVWNRLAKKYDRLWVQKYSLTPTRRELIKRIKEIPVERMLDVGCGTGQLIELVQSAKPEAACTGVDKSAEMIHQARRKGLDAEFIQVDICGNGAVLGAKGSYDLITCTHSFPYYPCKRLAAKRIFDCLKAQGTAVFIQASVNNWYDRLIMSVIEVTAERAEYLSKEAFATVVGEWFEVAEEFTIREKWFMPSICGFVLRKKR